MLDEKGEKLEGKKRGEGRGERDDRNTGRQNNGDKEESALSTAEKTRVSCGLVVPAVGGGAAATSST